MTYVVVHSPKGGTGKSSIAFAMGVTLALADKRVLLLDWDLMAPSQYFWARVEHTQVNLFLDDHLWKEEISIAEVICESSIKNLDIIFANPRPSATGPLMNFIHGVRGPSEYNPWEDDEIVFEDLAGKILDRVIHMPHNLREAQKTYDHLIFDNRYGLDVISIFPYHLVERVVYVVRPDVACWGNSIHFFEEFYDRIACMRNLPITLVINQIPTATMALETQKQRLDAQVTSWEEELKMEFPLITQSVRIPCLCNIAALDPLDLLKDDSNGNQSEFAQAIEQLIELSGLI